MEKTELENAIRDEAEQSIRALRQKEAEEIKKLDDAYAAEIDDFKNGIRAQTDAKIRQESAKVENRSNLDLKKLKLRSMEAFIIHAVDDSMKGIRDNPKYKEFLMDAIGNALGQIPSRAEILLKGEDLALEREIRGALKISDGASDVIFREESNIKWGGCIIKDMSGGRIFDSTVERIYFRRSAAIRREVMALLSGMSGEKA